MLSIRHAPRTAIFRTTSLRRSDYRRYISYRKNISAWTTLDPWSLIHLKRSLNHSSFFICGIVIQTLHAFMKTDPVDFKLDRTPVHSGWIYQFTLQALQTRNSSTDVIYFVYPTDSVFCRKSVTVQLSLNDLQCFPLDFLYSSTTSYQEGYRKVLLINRGSRLSAGIALDDYQACCDQQTEEHFFANVSLLGE